ncbi:MAG: hypothetical protein HDT12_04985 [Helicobacter sp.]|nr:hypothetical protein [Helicobacter sp.]
MAELSAKERYDNADLDAFSAYSDACSQHEEHVRQYNDCFKEYERICDSYTEIRQEISEKAKVCKEAHQSADSDTNVVVIGIMNHGKSTMLNALLDNTDDSLFKVADKRETRENQYERRNGICWTDTPGFDADEDDDNKALAGIKHLKIGLFVHKASTGELHANEVEVLRKISNTYEKTFMDNTCIVLNKDINDDEELKRVHEKISEQLEDLLGESLKIFPCNPKSYQKGFREHKKILMGKSGITELRDWIKSRCEVRDIRIDQTSRILEPEIRQKCKKAIEKLERGIQYIEEQVQLAAICSENLHSAIKEIERNKDRMRGLRKEVMSDEKVSGGLLGGGGGAAVGAAIGSIVPFFGTLTGAAIGAALGSTAGATSSDFDEEHNSNMEMHNDHINELNEKKNDVVESIRDFRRWQDELRGFLQEMQECHESWE